MQVYQLAKEMGYDNKTFKTKISEIGIAGKDSHFNKLTDSEIALIKSKIIDGRLGINASHGCVRLSIENAKWIYDTIPSGTKVIVY